MKISWIIRPATPEDAKEASELLHLSYSTLLARDYPSEYQPGAMEAILPIITRPDDGLLNCGTWYLVFHPDPPHQLVGCGGWSLKPAAYDGLEVKEPIPNLRLFATHPNYLRCGIGLCIWDQIKRDMKHYRLQGRPISVFSSLPGESFYAKLGFRTIKRSDARIVADHYLPCILMRLEKENGLICESSNDRN